MESLQGAVQAYAAVITSLSSEADDIESAEQQVLSAATSALSGSQQPKLLASNAYIDAVDVDTGQTVYRGLMPGNNLSLFLRSDSSVRISAFDTASMSFGQLSLQTSGSGSSAFDNSLLMLPLSTLNLSVGPSGLPAIVESALGGNPNQADNFIPGVTDLEAVQEGLLSTPSLVNTTGVIASVPLLGEAQAIMLIGSTTNTAQQTAYVATGSYGLAIVDASDYQSPTVLAQMQLTGTATDVAVDATLGLAAVATGSGGLDIIDVSNPTSPMLVSASESMPPRSRSWMGSPMPMMQALWMRSISRPVTSCKYSLPGEQR